MRTGFWAMLAVAAVGWPLTAFAAEAEYEWRGGRWVAMTQPVAGTPEGEVAIIRRLVDDNRNREAVRAAEAFLKKYADHPAREEAMMLAGQAQMNRGLYWQAYEWFKKQIEQYPGGVFSERALNREYEIGDAFLKGKKRLALGLFWLTAYAEGVEILQRIAEQAPGSAIAEKSLLRVADYYYADRQWDKAAQAYDQYLELFGKSNSAPYASLQAARATFGEFRGIAYDETPLLEAQQRFTTFAQRFPRAAERNNVENITASIVNYRAEMTLDTARFYMRTGHPEAAAFYFRLVIQRFPDSSAADEARRKLGLAVEPGAAPPYVPAGPGVGPKPAPATAPEIEDIFQPATAPADTGNKAGQ